MSQPQIPDLPVDTAGMTPEAPAGPDPGPDVVAGPVDLPPELWEALQCRWESDDEGTVSPHPRCQYLHAADCPARWVPAIAALARCGLEAP